jgi:hypothetical protein
MGMSGKSSAPVRPTTAPSKAPIAREGAKTPPEPPAAIEKDVARILAPIRSTMVPMAMLPATEAFIRP